MIEELADQIFSRQEFKRDYESLISVAVSRLVGHDLGAYDDDVLQRLLQSAAIFALSQNPDHRERVYSIISSLIDSDGEIAARYGKVIRLILARLGNLPSAKFFTRLESQYSQSLERNSLAELEEAWEEVTSSLAIADGSEISLTRFQHALWNDLSLGKSIAVTAPTSAGKTFVVRHYLIELIKRKEKSIVFYIVPTRALMSEVTSSIYQDIKRAGLATLVTNAPSRIDFGQLQSLVLVVTQERLKGLQNDHPEFYPDVVIVDEAQQIGSSGRGGLLETVLAALNGKTSKAQFIFLMPPAKGLDLLARKSGRTDLEFRVEKLGAVGQTVIKVNTDTDKKFVLQVWEGKTTSVQTYTVPHMYDSINLGDKEEKIAFAAKSLSGGYPTLVYFDTAAGCEAVAKKMGNTLSKTGDDKEKQRLDLAKYIRESSHPDYSLADAIVNGVAFHYGNMPSNIRRAVEDAFHEGVVSTVISTSTLLYGVNLPAKNVFLLDPRRGSADDDAGVPLTPSEFWNLVGRAGRLGKEWSGNAFVVDYDRWETKLLDLPKESTLTSGFDAELTHNRSEILGYIKGERNGNQQAIDQILAKLHVDYLLSGTDHGLIDLGYSASERLAVLAWFDSVSKSLFLPKELVAKHPGILPLGQNKLAKYFADGFDKKRKLEEFELIFPFQSGSWTALKKALSRINRQIYDQKLSDKYIKMITSRAMEWMKGESLPEMINKFHDWRTKNSVSGEVSVNTSVRNMFKLIEQDIRFRVSRDINCYIDILSYVAQQKGVVQGTDYSLLNLSTYIELGACDDIALELMGFGVSRATAMAVRRVVSLRPERMSMEYLIRQLSKQKVLDSISPFARKELHRIFGI